MRGHIVKRRSRYYAVVYEGIDPATGKGRHRWYPGGETRRDADKVLAALVKRQHDGDYKAPDRITLGAYLTERWLPTKRAQLRRSTFDSYERNIANHVVPGIGSIPLQRLTAEDLDEFYARLLVEGRLNGDRGGLSVKTVRYIHTIVRKALADAQRKGSVQRNVADLADPPKLSSAPKRPMKVWTAEQLREFLDGIRDHRLHPAIYLAANTGMRRGEILGIRWEDIDVHDKRLSVRHTVLNVAYKIVIADVKTPMSRRTVDLDPRTLAVLKTWKRAQVEERVALGVRPGDDSLVFAEPDGTPIHPDSYSQYFERLVAASNVPRIRLHDLRHTHATILLKAGVPAKVVSERLGHANVAFTMSVYQHILPGMQADAAHIFANIVFGD
ncbi:MAG: site-specific integrase [Mycolicibacterium neoaurum]|nr:site-specific integrase [Mycolicibacterium neoaurum]